LSSKNLTASFRDPSGHLFMREGKILRQINASYQDHYQTLMQSGLYAALVGKGWLISHQELEETTESPAFLIIEPEQIPYISYPYEWCFSQIKDAAILTLNIQLEALKYGMFLKDASAYNVQFLRGKPVFIDSLSFETYQEGTPWVAYRQFCQHFLAPLALIARCDYRLLHLLRAYIDGIPLDLASQLLPAKSWFNYSLLAHIHLHSRTQKHFENTGQEDQQAAAPPKMDKLRVEGLVSSLLSAVQAQQWKSVDTEWGSYYEDTNYLDQAMLHKEKLVREYLESYGTGPSGIAADFGANTGKFSRIAASCGFYVLSHDVDEVAVEKNYREASEKGDESMLPLMLDLTNPSPGLGWASTERTAFVQRQRVDVGMALAIVHHIAISNNVPLESIAQLLATLCRSLIIEFVPKSDSQVIRLLATREDIFPDYNKEGFEQAFSQYFNIEKAVEVESSERTLYFMVSRSDD
jgi:hypothetical protein